MLDGVSHIVTEGNFPSDLRQLLFALVTRFKALDVTTLLTFEASSMYATGAVTDHGFSPVADNIILLRYARSSGEDRPSLTVLKTRGSPHDRATYYYSIAAGGVQVGKRVGDSTSTPASSSPPTQRSDS